MKTPIPYLALVIALGHPVSGAPADPAADLEAKLKETAESSPSGAKLMRELTDLYWKNEQVFGLIRTTGKFSRAQAEHPQRAEMMLKLLDGYAVTARHADVITTGKQFLDIFPNHALTNAARDRLATAYEHTGRGALAAKERRTIWQNRGAATHGVTSLRLSMLANNGGAYKEASALATAMVAKLPVDSLLTGVGFQGMQAAEQAEQWAEGLQIAKTLVRRQAPMNETAKRDLWFRTARFESRLGQHQNAIVSFRKALADGRDDVHRSLIYSMISAAKPPAEIEAEARRYLAAYPHRDDRHEPLTRAADAAANAKDTARALAIAEDVLRHNVTLHDLPRAYVRWCGEDRKRAEQGLLKLISENPVGVGTCEPSSPSMSIATA